MKTTSRFLKVAILQLCLAGSMNAMSAETALGAFGLHQEFLSQSDAMMQLRKIFVNSIKNASDEHHLFFLTEAKEVLWVSIQSAQNPFSQRFATTSKMGENSIFD